MFNHSFRSILRLRGDGRFDWARELGAALDNLTRSLRSSEDVERLRAEVICCRSVVDDPSRSHDPLAFVEALGRLAKRWMARHPDLTTPETARKYHDNLFKLVHPSLMTCDAMWEALAVPIFMEKMVAQACLATRDLCRYRGGISIPEGKNPYSLDMLSDRIRASQWIRERPHLFGPLLYEILSAQLHWLSAPFGPEVDKRRIRALEKELEEHDQAYQQFLWEPSSTELYGCWQTRFTS